MYNVLSGDPQPDFRKYLGRTNNTQRTAKSAGVPGIPTRKKLVQNFAIWVRQSFIRELWYWASHKRVSPTNVCELNKALEELGDPEQSLGDDGESPIFLLSTGWRSGSTLMQRLLVTDPQVMLWGEPMGEMALVSHIAQMLTRLSTFPDIRERCDDSNQIFEALPTSWIATLYPPRGDFRMGIRALFDRWLAEPARRLGFTRWGFKEVRLGAAEAILLHWLYPKAKFVLLTRNPYDCYRSLSDSGWHHIYYARPDVRVDFAAGLAAHWNRLALGFVELPEQFPAYWIRYEDLVSGKVNFRNLESWLGIRLGEETALSAYVGATARRHRLGWSERLIISHEAAAGIKALGYQSQ